ncbi:unnamed protein product [Chrysoparadoxa australica]
MQILPYVLLLLLMTVCNSGSEGITFTKETCFVGPEREKGVTRDTWTPADFQGAASFDVIVTAINSRIHVYNKINGDLVSSAPMYEFFGYSQSWIDTDPRVIYDQEHDRFVVTMLAADFEFNTFARMYFAVSPHGNPGPDTPWHIDFASTDDIPGSSTWGDYPSVLADEKYLYATLNQFTFVGNIFKGTVVRIYDKLRFYDGSDLELVYRHAFESNLFQMTLAKMGKGARHKVNGVFLAHQELGGDGLRVYHLKESSDAAWEIYASNILDFDLAQGDGGVDVVAVMPCAHEVGTAYTVDTNDDRLIDAVWRDDVLYTTATVSVNGVTKASWFAVRTDITDSPTTYAELDSGVVQADLLDTGNKVYTFYPSVSVNAQGNLLIGFSASSNGLHVGAYAAGQVSRGEPLQVLELQPGLGVLNGGRDCYRWGDYSGTTTDPADSGWWVFNQYGTSPGNYGTIMCKVKAVCPPGAAFDANAVDAANECCEPPAVMCGGACCTPPNSCLGEGEQEGCENKMPSSC